MKYTKKQCQKQKIAVHVGENIELYRRINEMYNNQPAMEAYYGKEHCISIEAGCHANKEFYISEGYTVLSPEEFFNLEYEIY